MKLIDIDPIIKAIEARQENAEDLPPLTTGDFLRMLREASEPETLTNFDRIRAMAPEELAEFLKGYDVDVSGVYFCAAGGACPHAKECYDRFRGDNYPGCAYHSHNPVMEWKGEQDE